MLDSFSVGKFFYLSSQDLLTGPVASCDVHEQSLQPACDTTEDACCEKCMHAGAACAYWVLFPKIVANNGRLLGAANCTLYNGWDGNTRSEAQPGIIIGNGTVRIVIFKEYIACTLLQCPC